MKLTCADCGFEFDEAIVRDGLGWKGICPKCGQSFDVDIPKGLVVMMFVNDSDPEKDAENFVDDFKDAATIRTCYVFDSVADFAAAWRKMVGNPDGMWYFVLYKGKQISYCGNDDIWGFPAVAIRHTEIPKGTRICQFRLVKQDEPVEFEVVEDLGNPNRGGWGSTGTGKEAQ